VASCPDPIKTFSTAKRAVKPLGRDGETPWARISGPAIKRFLTGRADQIVWQIAEKDRIPKDEAEKRLADIRAVVDLFDQIEISGRSTADQFHITLHVRTSLPLKP
jgi:hypothetical protein